MKKITLALACTSILITPMVFAAGSSYITGNIQIHDRTDFNGADTTSTLETGHTFDSGTTLLVEFDAIQLGQTTTSLNNEGITTSGASPAYITIGVEQMFNLSNKLWVAAGYHQLLHDGKATEYRPLVKIGYNFSNGISISNRTRYQIQAYDDIAENGQDITNDKIRFDNNIAYSFTDLALNIKYNNVFYINEGDTKRNSMEHELRATWTRNGVQPYVEYRNQQDSVKDTYGHNNNVLVMGATYAF